MKPFISLLLLCVTTPVRLLCDVASGIAEGVSWHLAEDCSGVSTLDYVYPRLVRAGLVYAQKIGRPVRMMIGGAPLLIHSNDTHERVWDRYQKRLSLQDEQCTYLFRGKNTPLQSAPIFFPPQDTDYPGPKRVSPVLEEKGREFFNI
ncbi:MAG: hypothetical protein HGA67_00930 [Candidatus Yonathbacteria bacterium]|nr:hypothetical protein [Candidatus Yonathbacteria bacterium]